MTKVFSSVRLYSTRNLRTARLSGCAAVSFAVFAVSGCVAEIQDIGSVENRGDVEPLVKSSDLFAGEFNNLAEGEALAAALGNHNQIDRPNLTLISLTETSYGPTNVSVGDLDVDGDGILDIDWIKRLRKTTSILRSTNLCAYQTILNTPNGDLRLT